jgi:hypothetical protein
MKTLGVKISYGISFEDNNKIWHRINIEKEISYDKNPSKEKQEEIMDKEVDHMTSYLQKKMDEACEE